MVNLYPISVRSIAGKRVQRTLSTCRITLLRGSLRTHEQRTGQMNIGMTFENSEHDLCHAPLRADIGQYLGQQPPETEPSRVL